MYEPFVVYKCTPLCPLASFRCSAVALRNDATPTLLAMWLFQSSSHPAVSTAPSYGLPPFMRSISSTDSITRPQDTRADRSSPTPTKGIPLPAIPEAPDKEYTISIGHADSSRHTAQVFASTAMPNASQRTVAPASMTAPPLPLSSNAPTTPLAPKPPAAAATARGAVGILSCAMTGLYLVLLLVRGWALAAW